MNKVFIDTGFIVALVGPRDQFHRQAVALAKQYEGKPVVTTDVVLLEVGNALARNYRSQAIDILRGFLTADEVEIIHLDQALFNRAFSLYETHQDKEWGLVDCVSFVVMNEMKLDSALTFDHHFEQAGFQAMIRRTEL